VADSHSINPYANTDNDPTNNVDVDKNGTIDATDKLQWPGQEYEEPPKEAFLAYDGILANKDLYEDEYGVFMTGYAPIKNDQGEAIAVIAVDVRANEFFTITRQTLYPFLGFILLLILILTVLSSVIISIWNKRVYLFAELDRQKDELLSIVSHQLAAPVTSLKWYIELLQDGDLGVLQKEQQESISKMQSITVDLSDLVSMILDVSRIQLGKVKVTKDELDLSAFLQEILAVIEPRAKEKGINFVKAMPSSFPKIYIDKRLTRMTIENLLTNAIKYAPSGGHVEFRVEIRGNKLFASVKDTGCGIPKAEQSQMFSKLFRASNSRDKVEGNGFGLYVAKGAIESQGGKIWFESEVNKGTSFYIEMPYKKV
jgi:two-component system sensor histidine kinase VicK